MAIKKFLNKSSLGSPDDRQDLRYDHKAVEAKWSKTWQEVRLDIADIAGAKKPFYNLMMFPYPSAEGLHVGNMYAFTGSDIYGRFKRMQGLEVFEPIGLDGFGIHSENYALKIGRHPMDEAKVTAKRFYEQLHKIGAMYDWSRTLETYDPEYYRWTQWLFVQMFKHGLAYRGKAEVNWCPSDKTVLADEQVIDGRCERCGNLVEKKVLEQWFFRITAYAGKLLENLDSLDWSEKIKVAQRNWIGKKEGINIAYPVVDEKGKQVGEVTCFTTRPDTNFGATFVVIAPEHPFITQLYKVIKNKEAVAVGHYVEASKNKSKEERIAEGREKTGVFTGLFCVNQLNSYKMPLYVSDFVVMGVGTGAVVGVPGHDIRDFEFAKKIKLPIVRVVIGKDGDKTEITKLSQVQEEEGRMINSGFLNGLEIHGAIEKMMDYLEEKGWGKRVTTYHLRDWLPCRQRYWGPPTPMIFCVVCEKNKKGERKDMPGWYSVPEDELPVLLPRIVDYKPGEDGIAPLAKHKNFYNVTCPGCGSDARRETDVLDTFVDSSWYFLRYPSVGYQISNIKYQKVGKDTAGAGSLGNFEMSAEEARASARDRTARKIAQTTSAPGERLPWDPEVTKKWLPVDMYTGGAEHSVLHLMYSRFVTMALHDWEYLDFDEPFTRFYAHGLVIKDGAKMSKSKGNVVNPDEYIASLGADSLRLYLMFMGPFDLGGDFRDTAMEGMARWVNRLWRMAMQSIAKLDKLGKLDQSPIHRALNRLVKKVTEDIEKRHYNTAIAAMMEFTNLVADEGGTFSSSDLKTFILLLAPFAPFLAEELWFRASSPEVAPTLRRGSPPHFSRLSSVHREPWPSYNPSALAEETVEIVVQVNGKLREAVQLSSQKGRVQQEVEAASRQSPKVKKFLEGRGVRRVVFIPGRLINFVVS